MISLVSINTTIYQAAKLGGKKNIYSCTDFLNSPPSFHGKKKVSPLPPLYAYTKTCLPPLIKHHLLVSKCRTRIITGTQNYFNLIWISFKLLLFSELPICVSKVLQYTSTLKFTQLRFV